MEKKEKFTRLERLVQKLGLSSQEVGEYFSAKAEKCSTQEVLPGMYVYADGKISGELIPCRQVKAVVSYVEDGIAYAVCLQQKKLPWSSDMLEANTTQRMADGQEATRDILEFASREGLKAEAAQWCHDYAEDGVTQGEAFLPSVTELEKQYLHKEEINDSLGALGVDGLYGWCWPSTEYSDFNAYLFSMDAGHKYFGNKDSEYIVRPVIAVKI